MKKPFIIFVFFGNWINAQINLVPNWSFENYTSCPMSSGQVTLAIPWGSATATSSTDYFNSCSSTLNVPNYPSGFQLAKTGMAYAGMWVLQTPNYREYLQVKLDSLLKANICYYVEFYVNLGDGMPCAVNNISANLSITQPFSTVGILMPLTPHITKVGNPIINDSINWVKISGYYTATGGEQYLTIGNFFSDLNTNIIGSLPSNAIAYYFIDDVSVEEVKVKQWNYTNTSLCLNEDIVLNPNTNDTNAYTLNWMPSTGLSCSSCSITTAQPQVTTTYTLTKQKCNIIIKDTVTITVKNDCNSSTEIPNVFTPNADGVNDVWLVNLGFGNTFKSCMVYNRWGLEILNDKLEILNVITWSGRTTSGIECSAGVYFYTLEYTNILGEQKKVNGYVTLIR